MRPDNSTNSDTSTTSTSVFVYPLDGDVSDCIWLLPKPGCGYAPTQAGDRGGGLQFAVFSFMIIGIAVIFTVVFRNVMRRDKQRENEADNAADNEADNKRGDGA